MNKTKLKQGSLKGLRKQTNECLDAAYNKGLEDGNKIADKDLKEIQDSTYDVAYNKGVEDFENLFVHEHDYEQFFEDTYGSKNPDYNLYDLVAKYGAKKVLDDFKNWQEEKKKDAEIKIGDICIYKDPTVKFIITKIDEGKFFDGILLNGTSICDGTISLIKKVGHCDELQQLLDKMKGEN